MSSGPDDDRRQPTEPTFADVMNSFSFDANRTSRRRKWGRKRGGEAETSMPPTAAQAMPPPSQMAPPSPTPGMAGPPTGPIDYPAGPPGGESEAMDSGASAVRPYAWTRGRTKSGLDLAIETLVSTSQRARDQIGLLQVEHRAVAELCEQTRSVAEVAALLSIPLGVARVLLGDMAGLNLVTVHQTATTAGDLPDIALMERVLSGLRRL